MWHFVVRKPVLMRSYIEHNQNTKQPSCKHRPDIAGLAQDRADHDGQLHREQQGQTESMLQLQIRHREAELHAQRLKAMPQQVAPGPVNAAPGGHRERECGGREAQGLICKFLMGAPMHQSYSSWCQACESKHGHAI